METPAEVLYLILKPNILLGLGYREKMYKVIGTIYDYVDTPYAEELLYTQKDIAGSIRMKRQTK